MILQDALGSLHNTIGTMRNRALPQASAVKLSSIDLPTPPSPCKTLSKRGKGLATSTLQLNRPITITRANHVEHQQQTTAIKTILSPGNGGCPQPICSQILHDADERANHNDPMAEQFRNANDSIWPIRITSKSSVQLQQTHSGVWWPATTCGYSFQQVVIHNIWNMVGRTVLTCKWHGATFSYNSDRIFSPAFLRRVKTCDNWMSDGETSCPLRLRRVA